MCQWYVWRLDEVKKLIYAVQSLALSLNAAEVMRTPEEDRGREQ
jgi:hypothetical protein